MCKLKLIFCASVIIFVIFSSHHGEVRAISLTRVKKAVQTYTTKYDNVDIDTILASTRLLNNYIKCLLDKGPCNTQEAKTLKRYLPDAISTGCAKCSQAQRKLAGRILSVLLLDHKDDWDQLTAKYDPDGIFRKMYLDEGDDYSDLEQA